MEEQKRPLPADFFKDWKDREALAEGMIPLIGKLYREHNVVIEIYGHSLVNRSVIHILKEHRYVRQIEEQELSPQETYPVLEALSRLALGASVIDIGKLAKKFKIVEAVLEIFQKRPKVSQSSSRLINTPNSKTNRVFKRETVHLIRLDLVLETI